MSTGTILDLIWSKTSETYSTKLICETSLRKTEEDKKIYSD